MSQTPVSPSPSKFLHRILLAGGGAFALFAGCLAAPSLMSRQADAQEIVIAPPTGAPMSFADLIQRVSPAVVSIQVRQSPGASTGPALEGLPPGFEEFFRGQPNQGPAPTALGSGFFIDESGVIVTNHHVVEGAEEITITTSDGRELEAELIGSDQATDIAVLRITDSGQRFPFVTFDEDSDMRVGDWVVAVGNPFGLQGTATAGIISAMGRRDAGSSAYVDYMQIDAPINRGNSGGPTFDLRGRVIGVNSAIFSPTGGNVGIGFAIPSNTASLIVEQLRASGRVTRGWLGVSIQTQLDSDLATSLGLSEARGALIANVQEGSPAQSAGLQTGDVILSFNGTDIQDSRDLTQRVGSTAIGTNARVEIMRGGNRRTLNVRLAERPSEQQLAASNTPAPGEAGPRTAPGATTPGVATAGLGVTVRGLSAEDRTRLQLDANVAGLVVTNVEPRSDLAEKGVAPGDVILQAGGQAVRSAEQLSTAVAAARSAGRPLLLQIQTRVGRRYVAAQIAAE